jgi:hypothetical protein
MATKKAVKKASPKAAAPRMRRKTFSGSVSLNAECPECTWGFEAKLDETFKTKEFHVKAVRVKDSEGKAATWPDGTPVYKFVITN